MKGFDAEPEMNLAEVEAHLGITFPERHRQALQDPHDLIRRECDFLLLSSPHELLDIVHVNDFLHDPGHWNRWPSFLVAFASNGCGDYFAYDLRNQPPSIIYIDPDYTVEKNLAAKDKLQYESFEAWYAWYEQEAESDRQAGWINPFAETD
jgi:SMI1/KNR4 family protein SUKH-1